MHTPYISNDGKTPMQRYRSNGDPSVLVFENIVMGSGSVEELNDAMMWKDWESDWATEKTY